MKRLVFFVVRLGARRVKCVFENKSRVFENKIMELKINGPVLKIYWY